MAPSARGLPAPHTPRLTALWAVEPAGDRSAHRGRGSRSGELTGARASRSPAGHGPALPLPRSVLQATPFQSGPAPPGGTGGREGPRWLPGPGKGSGRSEPDGQRLERRTSLPPRYRVTPDLSARVAAPQRRRRLVPCMSHVAGLCLMAREPGGACSIRRTPQEIDRQSQEGSAESELELAMTTGVNGRGPAWSEGVAAGEVGGREEQGD